MNQTAQHSGLRVKAISLLVGILIFSPCFPRAGQLEERVSAKQILEETGVEGGLVVHLGCSDGRLTAELASNDSFLVQGLDTDPENVRQAREHIESLGLYGRVSIDRLTGEALPYIDNLVNLIVVEDPGDIPPHEIQRVLCPGGVARLKKTGEWTTTVKPRPSEIDDWTHYLHDSDNNAVAQDSVVGPPRHLQWVGSPRWSRQHDHMSAISALVTSGGRIFYIMDEGSRASIYLPSKWKLIARDAFNGTVLWKRPIENWHTRFWPLKSGPSHLPRRLIAMEDEVYATLGIDAPLVALNAATGKTLRTYAETQGTEEVIASEGVLLLVVNDNPVKRYQPESPYADIAEIKQAAREKSWEEEPSWILAVQADSGAILWKRRSVVVPLTLAADSERVYYHNGEEVVALNRENGEEIWTSEKTARRSNILSFFAPTLVVHKDVVLFAGGDEATKRRGGEETMSAFSAETGETLWEAPHPSSGYRSPEDVLVTGGLVWTGATTSPADSGVLTGRDPLTGEVVTEFPPDVDTYWFHHRCYRGKATERFLMMSRTGIEFVDFQTENWLIHHWVRGACLYGVMPANGLLYAPPHPCACYPEAKLFGFSALGPKKDSEVVQAVSKTDDRLEKGPAFKSSFTVSANSSHAEGENWPTYRHDFSRSGYTKTSIPNHLKQSWETDLGGRLSSPVIADGKIFVASVDAHTVHALDAVSGERLWSYTTGGRVDSPPTVYEGRVIFGSADGSIYCLRAQDGELVWRRLLAPADHRLVAYEQVESVWPLHGNVLVQDGVVCCACGRSLFLDGGIRLFRLDLGSGEILSETVLDDRDPETGKPLQDRIQILNMPAGLTDVLSSDGQHVYMRSQVFDLEGNRKDLGPHSGDPVEQAAVQSGETAHLFCPTGFLDGSWFHRTYWVYGRSFAGGHAGYYQAGKFAPSGRILVFDDSKVYGFGRKPKYLKWTTPLEYQLFASDKEAPVVPKELRRGGGGSMIRIKKSASLNPKGKPLTVEAWVKAEKPNGVVAARGGPSHGYALILKGGKPRFVVRINGAAHSVSAKKKVVGDWAHLVGVLTPDKKTKIYVNGELSATGEAPDFITSDPAQAMEIGADAGGGVGDYQSPYGFTGIIDEVRVYHRALDHTEITAHYSKPDKIKAEEDKLVLSLSFDNGEAKDESGNNNHGEVGSAKTVPGKSGGAFRFVAKPGRRGDSYVQHHWDQEIPLLPRAMVLAGETLFIAGPPDVLDEEEAYKRINDPEIQEQLREQDAALNGKKGAMLWAVSTSDGSKQTEYDLDSPPTWDGMAAAYGQLYMTTTSGNVLCLAGEPRPD